VACFGIYCIIHDKKKRGEIHVVVGGGFSPMFSQFQSPGVLIIRTPALYDDMTQSQLRFGNVVVLKWLQTDTPKRVRSTLFIQAQNKSMSYGSTNFLIQFRSTVMGRLASTFGWYY
jgi:hypothetical protein